MRFILVVLLLSVCAHAADFSKADELYAKRENNLEAIHQAVAIYRAVITNAANPAEKAHAITQLGRLTFYEGELLTPKENTARRMEIFAQLQIDAESAGSSFWKTLALGLWSQSAGVAAAWWYLDDFKAVAQKALLEEPGTEEGGIFRILAAVYANNMALTLYGLYDLDLALQYANKAVELGANRLDAYLVKAYVLYQSGRSEEARELVKKTIEIFSAKPSQDPETKAYLERARQSIEMF